jgi:hypothetical protein
MDDAAKAFQRGTLMNKSSHQLKTSLAQIRVLILFQHAVRYGLRAVWLGLAGYLLGWGFYHLLGILSDARLWIMISCLFILTAVISFFVSWTPTRRLVWKLDREFNLKEQVSTAWSVIAKQKKPNPFGELLIEDTLPLLKKVRIRLFKHGWFLLRDFVSLLLVLLAWIGILYPSTFRVETSILPEQSQPEALLAIAEDPVLTDILPKGVLSLDAETQQTNTSDNTTAASETSNSDYAATLSNALKKVGDELSQQSTTYNLGKALQDLDLNQAADILDALAKMAESLPQSSKDQIAQSMQTSAGTLQQAMGDNQLSDDLSKAADALSSDQTAGQGNPAGQAIQKLASDLRQTAQELQNSQAAAANEGDSSQGNQTGNNGAQTSGGKGAGSGASSAQQGQSESIPRLQGGDGILQLPTSESSQAGVLTGQTPSGTDILNSNGISGSGNSLDTVNNVPIQGPIFPYYYSWDWRNVISQYFQRTH